MTQVLVSHGSTASNKSFLLGINAQNKPFCTAGANTITSSTALNGASHMVTCTFDSSTSTMRLYYNRDIVAVKTGVFAYSSATVNTLSVGAKWLQSSTPTDHFDGWIDELTVYNSALTTREVEQLYNQPRAPVSRVPTRTATKTR